MHTVIQSSEQLPSEQVELIKHDSIFENKGEKMGTKTGLEMMIEILNMKK